MKRLLTVLALVALMTATTVAIAAPAMADSWNDRDDWNGWFFGGFGDNRFDNLDFFDNGVDQESESGDVSLGFDVSNSGDYASQCTPATQFGNTGNFQNASSFVQFGSGSDNDLNDFGFFSNDGFLNRGGIDDFEPEGIDVSFAPQQDVNCSNTIEQSSAASS